MGVHVSFVQSVGMDKWSEKNLRTMLVGGNARAKAYFRQHGFDSMADKAGVAARYSSPSGRRYAKMLADDVMTKKPEEAVAQLFHQPVRRSSLRLALSPNAPPSCRHQLIHTWVPGK
jgi:ADP-ribosylation factor GTPase-activating protein 2/3|eukprot:SAG25_NODE_1049_length_4179_cov_2.842157_2_plen_117_part_00